MILWGDRLHSRLEWLRDTLVRNAGSVVPGLLAITGVICIALPGSIWAGGDCAGRPAGLGL